MGHSFTHSEDDERTVAAQLNRTVRGRWGVARRCHLGIPMVIASHPRLEDGTPFPTTLWLTCPVLVKRTSALESSGYMSGVTQRLAQDRRLRERLRRALDRYRAMRDEFHVLGPGPMPGGGPDRVKCLHAHVAHELADPPNPVGALTLSSAGWPDCVRPCVDPVSGSQRSAGAGCDRPTTSDVRAPEETSRE